MKKRVARAINGIGVDPRDCALLWCTTPCMYILTLKLYFNIAYFGNIYIIGMRPIFLVIYKAGTSFAMFLD